MRVPPGASLTYVSDDCFTVEWSDGEFRAERYRDGDWCAQGVGCYECPLRLLVAIFERIWETRRDRGDFDDV